MLLAGLALLSLAVFSVHAADVVNDGDMEDPTDAAWPRTDLVGANSSGKDGTQSASGQSLRILSEVGRRADVEWFNSQNVGTVNDTDTVFLSLWYGYRFNLNDGGANGTLAVDIRPASGSWTTIWTQTLSPVADTFQSATATNIDVGSFFTTPTTYDIRLYFVGRTGGDNNATVEVWWDDIVLDVTTAAPTNDSTTIQDNVGVISSCRQLTATTRFTGDDDGDGSTQIEYGTSATGPWTVACANLQDASPRTCIVPALSPATDYWLRFDYVDPDGVVDTPTGSDGEVVGPLSLGACGADDSAPTVLVGVPSEGAILTATDRVKVQVFDEGGLVGTDPVLFSIDGGAFSNAVVVNANYDCGTGCAIYEFDLDTTALTDGPHDLVIQAFDQAGNLAEVGRAFRARNGTGAGSGFLLRRTRGSQLCIDCHNLPTHSSQSTDTGYGNWAIDCLTCHTAHQTRNIFLIRETLPTPNSGDAGVLFHFDDRTNSTNPGSAPGDFSFLGDRSGALNAPYNDGICEACHTRTTHWRNDTSGGDHSHNAGTRCLDCHGHDTGFAATGGSGCRGCHGANPQGSRRPVDADFSLQSHHVGNGGQMGGLLTDFDCVVCHAEGTVNAGQAERTAWHNDGLGVGGNHRIDLKNADDVTVVFSYDKDEVANQAGAAANWHSGNATWRDQTSTALDPFCLSCHDSTGASDSFNVDDGGSAGNPFGDTMITNNYDLQDRISVIDIASKVSGAPPPQGDFSRHAIRGQSTSRYGEYTNIVAPLGGSSMYDAGYFTNMGTSEDGPLWNDTSVMGCADCHTVDGANGSAGNAHGSGSEYLLKDASGGATEGNYDLNSGTFTYVCYRCHIDTQYQGNTHTGSSSDWHNTVVGVGDAERKDTDDGNVFGMACTNCHGGTGFGTIHGTSEIIPIGQDGGGVDGVTTRNAYRFMNGAGLRFYNPEGWEGTSAACFTLSNNTTPDDWGSCTKHNRGTGFTKPLQRPINY